MKRYLITIASIFGIVTQMMASDTNHTVSSPVDSNTSIFFLEEKLYLMYQSFLYNSDLKNAKKVVQQAIKQYPDHTVWYQRGLELSRWTEDKIWRVTLLQHLRQTTNDNTLTDELLSVTLNAKRYDIALPILQAKLQQTPTPQISQQIVSLYQEEGKTQEAIQLLYQAYQHHKSDIYLIKDAYRLSNAQGLQSWNNILSVIINKSEKSYLTSKNTQFSSKDTTHRSLASNAAIQPSQIPSLATIYRHIKHKNATLTEYEKALFDGYKSSNFASYAIQIALQGYLLSNNPYMVEGVLYKLISHNNTNRALTLVTYIQKHPKQFNTLLQRKEFQYLTLQLLEQTQQSHLSQVFFSSHPKLQKDATVLSSLLWSSLNRNNIEDMQYYIHYLETYPVHQASLWFPLASTYYHLQKFDRSKLYIQKLLQKEPNNIDARFLYAYILQAQGKERAFMQQIESIYTHLTHQAEANPSKLKEQRFLSQYLSAAIYLLDADSFKNRLNLYRPYLSKERYQELLASWAIQTKSYNLLTHTTQQMHTIPPWLQLNLALHNRSEPVLQTLLEKYNTQLPISDSIYAAQQLHQPNQAYSWAYQGLKDNQESYQLYQQLVHLAQTNSNSITLQSDILNRADSLLQTSVNFQSLSHLPLGVQLHFKAIYRHNHITDGTVLHHIKSDESALLFKVSKPLQNGSFSMSYGYTHALKNYHSFSSALLWQINSRISSQLSLFWQTSATETTYLLLGGYKSGGKATLSYTLLPSTQILFQTESAHFYSQDDVEIGKGEHSLLLLRHTLRQGYPDISIAPFIEYGHFTQTTQEQGIIETIIPDGYKALPDDFTNLGINIQYGLQTEIQFVRPWRPFGEATLIYDLENSQFTYALRGGISGSVGSQGKVTVGVEYSQSLLGTQETSSKCYINYKLLY